MDMVRNCAKNCQSVDVNHRHIEWTADGGGVEARGMRGR